MSHDDHAHHGQSKPLPAASRNFLAAFCVVCGVGQALAPAMVAAPFLGATEAEVAAQPLAVHTARAMGGLLFLTGTVMLGSRQAGVAGVAGFSATLAYLYTQEGVALPALLTGLGAAGSLAYHYMTHEHKHQQ